jgi:hypothetical protein
MKLLIAVLMTSLTVFAVATAWVDYVQPHLKSANKTVASSSMESPAPKRKSRRVALDQGERLLPVPSQTDEGVSEPVRSRAALKSRVVDRNTEDVRSELSDRLDEVKDQESRLASRQEALRMMYDDIRAELSNLDELRRKTSEELAAAEQGRTEIAKRQPGSRDRTTGTQDVPVAMKDAAADPATRGTALFIRRLVDQGKSETAVSLLKSMKAREAAAVLANLSTVDRSMANRLADSVRSTDDATVRR